VPPCSAASGSRARSGTVALRIHSAIDIPVSGTRVSGGDRPAKQHFQIAELRINFPIVCNSEQIFVGVCMYFLLHSAKECLFL
jgi:hypothetical protein